MASQRINLYGVVICVEPFWDRPSYSVKTYFYHQVYPPPQQSRYLLPELVMASRMMLALAPARNRASYSTLINWYLEEWRVLDLYFVGCSIVNRGCRCQTVVNKLPLTLSKICKSRIFVFESSLVNKSCGEPSTRHVFADSHQCQLRSETVSRDMVTTSWYGDNIMI